MLQIHRRFTDEQVKVLLQGYCQGQLARIDLQELLDIGKSRFFALLKTYRQDPEGFTCSPLPIGGHRQPNCLQKWKMRSRQLCFERKPLLKILTYPFRVTTTRPSRIVWTPRESRYR